MLMHEKGDLQKFISINKGQIIEADMIKFDNVPIVSPNGDKLLKNLDFEIKKGENCIVKGSNGCGKSSMLRVLASLWPLFGGKLYRPPQ